MVSFSLLDDASAAAGSGLVSGRGEERVGTMISTRVTDSWIQVWTCWRENVDQRQDGGEEERETESKAAEDSQF